MERQTERQRNIERRRKRVGYKYVNGLKIKRDGKRE